MKTKVLTFGTKDYVLFEDGRMLKKNRTTTDRFMKGFMRSSKLLYKIDDNEYTAIELVAEHFIGTDKEYTDIVLIDPSLPISIDNVQYINIPKNKIFEYDNRRMKMVKTNVAITDKGELYNFKTNIYSYGVKNNAGYYETSIDKCTRRIHRLVAQAFIANPDNLPVVDHINENKIDNSASNLRWCTSEQNTQYYHNLREDRRILEITKKNKELRQKMKICNLKEKRLNKQIKELHEKEIKQEKIINKLNLKKEELTKMIERFDKYHTNENSSGVEVKINDKIFESITAAAKYIHKNEPERVFDTIKTEIRKIIHGKRKGNLMYKTYKIS